MLFSRLTFIVMRRLQFVLTILSAIISFQRLVTCTILTEEQSNWTEKCTKDLYDGRNQCSQLNFKLKHECVRRIFTTLKKCLQKNSHPYRKEKDNFRRSCAGDCWGQFYQCGTLIKSTLDQWTCIRGREVCMHLCRK